MRWIYQKDEFAKLVLSARDCVYIDSGRVRTDLSKVIFDDAELCTENFCLLLRDLMTASQDDLAYYTVFDPDPEHYFYRLFGKYPCLEIEASDLAERFLNTLNEPINGNPAEAIGTNRFAYTINVPSRRWFIHSLYSPHDFGGHLWLPREWKDIAKKRGLETSLIH